MNVDLFYSGLKIIAVPVIIAIVIYVIKKTIDTIIENVKKNVDLAVKGVKDNVNTVIDGVKDVNKKIEKHDDKFEAIGKSLVEINTSQKQMEKTLEKHNSFQDRLTRVESKTEAALKKTDKLENIYYNKSTN